MAIPKEEISFESSWNGPARKAVVSFLCAHWPALLVISTIVTAPCLWLPHVEAGDLPSHLYNAWLAHLIKTGQAPGLWLAHQSNNVLFDSALSGLGSVLGWGVAEKVATCGAVLVFFWGAFALVCAMTRRVPWFLLPCLAIIAYGWTFQMGFMNYYISIGLAFFGLALLAGGRGWERGLVALLAPLIWFAHPVGLGLLVSFGAYLMLAQHIPERQHIYLFAASVLVILGLHFFIQVHYSPSRIIWSYRPPFVHDGADQLLLYGPQYLLPARLFRAFLWACLLLDIARRHMAGGWSQYLLPAELCALAFLGVLLLPTGFKSIGFLTERMTSVLAVLLCCLLGSIKLQKWHLAGFVIIAAIFFFFLYTDTAAINRAEAQLEDKVREIPPGSRVVASIVPLPGRVTTHHIIDRTCIGRCFSYDNYEPSTEQFRVRANPGNQFVLADGGSAQAAQKGNYVVQARDLPLFDIYQCDLSTSVYCVREVVAGDKTSSSFTRYDNSFHRFNAVSLLIDLSLGPLLILGAAALRWLGLQFQGTRS